LHLGLPTSVETSKLPSCLGAEGHSLLGYKLGRVTQEGREQRALYPGQAYPKPLRRGFLIHLYDWGLAARLIGFKQTKQYDILPPPATTKPCLQCSQGISLILALCVTVLPPKEILISLGQCGGFFSISVAQAKPSKGPAPSGSARNNLYCNQPSPSSHKMHCLHLCTPCLKLTSEFSKHG
jgi:hypothetical protein